METKNKVEFNADLEKSKNNNELLRNDSKDNGNLKDYNNSININKFIELDH